MIEVAQASLKAQTVNTGQCEYIQASAESLPFLEDGSVDLVIAGECLGHETFDCSFAMSMRS